MAAGLGFKTFTTGEVLTAADTNGYLMQGVLVFASAAARDAAITSPQEGQFAYLKDTNVTTYYTGSAWTNLDTTGMTNPMTTTGDMVYSSSGSTPARLGIGTTGQVVTVAGGIPSWATPTSGALVVVKARTTFSAVSDTGTTFASVFTSTYRNYLIVMDEIASGTNNAILYYRGMVDNSTVTSSNYYAASAGLTVGGTAANQLSAGVAQMSIMKMYNAKLYLNINQSNVGTGSVSNMMMTFNGYQVADEASITGAGYLAGAANAINGFILSASTGTITGALTIYGMATS